MGRRPLAETYRQLAQGLEGAEGHPRVVEETVSNTKVSQHWGEGQRGCSIDFFSYTATLSFP